MSNQENPCGGYVIEADKLEAAFLRSKTYIEWCKLHDALDFEEMVKFCDENFPLNVPRPSSFFILESGNDTSDGDLAYDVIYAQFEEEDLYERRPTDKLLELQNLLGYVPEQHSWTMFG